MTTQILTVRIEKSMSKNLTDIAKRNQRSRAAMVRWLIQQAIEQARMNQATSRPVAQASN